MYFFVDESGNTGVNLFDKSQPTLYYGVLSSKINFDDLTFKEIKELRKKLGVDRLHANVLGMERLVKIAEGLTSLQHNFNLHFDFYLLNKLDLALICFFDQVFDQGVNPAVPWGAYWTPLRYMLLLKVAILFDLDTLKKAWKARIQKNEDLSIKEFRDVSTILLDRLYIIPDERSRQIIYDTLTWSLQNPHELRYNTKSKRESYWIAPNLIGFQNVMKGIAFRITEWDIETPVIIVDQQSQFNKTQKSLAEFYTEARGLKYDFGTGLPEINFEGMPTTPIVFRSSAMSAGLEIFDVYLWFFKRIIENKTIAPEFFPLLKNLISIGIYNEISLSSIEDRWTDWFENLPEPTFKQWEAAGKMIEIDEQRRLTAIAASKQRQRLTSKLE